MMCVFLMFFGCFFFENVLKHMSIRIIPEAFRHHIKIVSKPTLSKIMPNKPWGNRPKSLSQGCFLFFFFEPTHRKPQKKTISLRQNHIQNHIRNISKSLSQSYQKPYQIHIKTIKKKRARNRPKACPPGFISVFSVSKPAHQEPRTSPLRSQTISKIISKTISKS